MDYRIEKKDAFQVLGCGKTFSYEDASTAVPAFWNEARNVGKLNVVCGEFGINIDEKMGNDTFEYLIADAYHGQPAPEGFAVKTIPAFDWAIFPCKGPMPTTLQGMNSRIFTEWLPANREYEFAAGYCIEMYDDPMKYPKGTADENYYCEIWIPVKVKQ